MPSTITRVHGRAGMEVVRTGSVKAGTVSASVPRIKTEYEIESPDEPGKVRAALANPVAFEDRTTLNDTPLSL